MGPECLPAHLSKSLDRVAHPLGNRDGPVARRARFLLAPGESVAGVVAGDTITPLAIRDGPVARRTRLPSGSAASSPGPDETHIIAPLEMRDGPVARRTWRLSVRATDDWSSWSAPSDCSAAPAMVMCWHMPEPIIAGSC